MLMPFGLHSNLQMMLQLQGSGSGSSSSFRVRTSYWKGNTSEPALQSQSLTVSWLWFPPWCIRCLWSRPQWRFWCDWPSPWQSSEGSKDTNYTSCWNLCPLYSASMKRSILVSWLLKQVYEIIPISQIITFRGKVIAEYLQIVLSCTALRLWIPLWRPIRAIRN